MPSLPAKLTSLNLIVILCRCVGVRHSDETVYYALVSANPYCSKDLRAYSRSEGRANNDPVRWYLNTKVQ
jgi:hypothetical protein